MIGLQNITKTYNTESGLLKALDDITLMVQPSERIGLIGKNGAGKSTLVRIIGGVEVPTRGKIIRQMSVSWPLAFRGAVQSSLTGMENIRFISRIYRKDFSEVLDHVEDFSELGIRLEDPVYTYSAGMRAKISFALSLAVEFDCYLIDEITAVGDKRFRRKCRVELLEKRADRAIIMVSHNPNVIKEYCSVCIAMDRGKCVDRFELDGTIKQLKRWQEL